MWLTAGCLPATAPVVTLPPFPAECLLLAARSSTVLEAVLASDAEGAKALQNYERILLGTQARLH